MVQPSQVFIVEDDPEILNALSSIISEHGYTVTKFQSAREAIVVIGSTLPDCVITDLNAPGERSGLTVIEKVRSKCLSLPILLISGDNLRAEEENFLKQKNVRTMKKPIRVSEVLAFLSLTL